MTSKRTIEDLRRIIREAADEVEAATGTRPESVALSRKLADQYGLFNGSMVDGVRILLFGNSPPKRPWYSDHWDLIGIGACLLLLAALAFAGPAQRPDCITPETALATGADKENH